MKRSREAPNKDIGEEVVVVDDVDAQPKKEPKEQKCIVINGVVYCKVCYPALCEANLSRTVLKKTARGSKGVFQGGMSQFRRHMKDDHATIDDARTPTKQTPTKQQTEFSTCRCTPYDLALFICRGNLSFNFFEDSSCQMMRQIFNAAKIAQNRRAIAELVVDQADVYWKATLLRHKGNAALLLIDGGTVLKRTFLNVCLAVDSEILFMYSHPVLRLDSNTVSDILETTIVDLQKSNIQVIGIVTDNASAMIKASAAHVTIKCEKDSVSDSDDETEEEDEGVEQEEVEVPHITAHFVTHIRCWAHSLQLVLADAAKHKLLAVGFACSSRVVADLSRRANKAKLAEVLAKNGSTLRTFVVPCVTRWNSCIKSMVRLLEIELEINQVLPKDEGINDNESYAMKMCVVVLAPICWCTDFVQSDSCTVLAAKSKLDDVKAKLDYVRGLNFRTSALTREVQNVCESVLDIIKARTVKNFNNRVIELLDFFDPSTIDNLEGEKVFADINLFFNDRGTNNAESHIRDTLRCFRTRTDEQKKMNSAVYWDSMSNNHAHVSEFIRVLRSICVTEASVERSFMAQTKIFKPERNRLSEVKMNACLMLKNAKGTHRKPINISNTIDQQDWLNMTTTLAQPQQAEAIRTIAARKHTEAMSLVWGDRVKVLWKVSGEDQWFSGIITSVVGNGKYEVTYKNSSAPVEFLPLTVDKKWEKIEY